MHSGAAAADGETESCELEEEEIVREAALRLVTRDMADVLGTTAYDVLVLLRLVDR